MRIVTTGVNAGIFSVDDKRKSIHVSTKHDSGSGFGAVDVGYDAGSADSADGIKTHFLQFCCDVVTGLVFVKAELRDLMKIGSHGYYIKIFSVHLIFLVEVILDDC